MGGGSWNGKLTGLVSIYEPKSNQRRYHSAKEKIAECLQKNLEVN